MRQRVEARNEQIDQSINDLKFNEPYDNYRPINVPARFDGQTLYRCLIAMHPHIGERQWQEWFHLGHILDHDKPVSQNTTVRGGQQFTHLFPDWIEPEVDSNVKILWEDDWIIAANKPAPLPVHPSGRFNRNTLTSLLEAVYQPSDLRVVHRLDANTTGVLLFARTAEVATSLRKQFEENRIEKRYLVQCNGQPDRDSFACDQSIAKQRGPAGSRSIDPDGHPAKTTFQLLHRLHGGTALLEACPQTGRTHQIRIHLWAMGLPVMGDPAYLKELRTAVIQTLSPTDPPMCLHAAAMRIIHPATGKQIQFEGLKPKWLAKLT